MPKAQKKTSSSTSTRPNPLSPRNANASKKPSKSKKNTNSTSPKATKDTKANEPSPDVAKDSQCESQDQSGNSDKTSNYIVQISLDGSSEPPINRLLSLPPWLTFDKVHEVLQRAFGWTNSHMHRFEVTLVDDEPINPFGPRPCLSLEARPDMLPDDLKENTKAEADVTLADVYEKLEWKNRAQIAYEYDMGDGWSHTFYLLGRATPGTNAQFHAPADVNIICLGGQGHGPAEDAGGIGGWEDLKDAFKHPRKAESKDLVSWYKTSCLNGDKKGLDPHDWDVMDVNDLLAEFQPSPPEGA